MNSIVTRIQLLTAIVIATTVAPSLTRLAAAADAAAAQAEAYSWRNVKIGGGGFIPGIVFSRAEKGLAYLRSDMGGCYRWDSRQNRWIPLQDSMPESSYQGGESIAPDPLDPNIVYVAAGMYRGEPSAILRSHDRGGHWDVYPVTFQMGGNEDGRGLGERLAIDPNDTSILYFGSRHDGLQRSGDHGKSWQKVESFPIKGRGVPARGQPSNPGLSFVVFDPKSSTPGQPSKTIFVGSADPGDHHLFRSDDAGKTWKVVPGEPKKEFLPAKAEIDDAGTLYVTYGNGPGPNGVTDGAVMKLDTKSGAWTDITPDQRPNRQPGGYCGLSLDRQKPGTLAVTTMNRWSPSDTVWRSTDGGKTWKDIVNRSERDVSATPFLFWGKPEPRLGWWMAAFAIDPFDSDRACYATGATIYATSDFSNVNKDQPTRWKPWVEGIEQTAVITLMSPGAGAHLISGFGDIGGFVHDDLGVSPPKGMFENPQFGNTNTLEYAGQRPAVIVRSGRPSEGQSPLGISRDGGKTWKPIALPASDAPAEGAPRRRRGAAGANPAITVSADGETLVLMTRPTAMVARSDSPSWTPARGLPANARPVADRVDPKKFYALDFKTGKLYTSTDAAATFVESQPSGLPKDISGDEPTWHEAAWPLSATTGLSGDLWLVSKAGLFHSADAGKSFTRADGGGVQVDALSFGKAAAGKEYPALFAIGTRDKRKALWRSDDAGRSWLRLNDDQHQWGTRFRCVAGDPRLFGRVYVGTDGRGILYGEPAASPRAGE